MHINEFDYELPEHLIARYPLPQRSASRLLCLSRNSGDITHRQFQNLPDLLQPGDLLIFNDTRVIPARLFATKITGGQCEILIERLADEHHAWAHVRASKAPKPGSLLIISREPSAAPQIKDSLSLIVKDRDEDLFFLESEVPFREILNKYGHMPLPPYFARGDESLDKDRYQTVYAQREGAVAAHTAGLHFDHELLKTLHERGIESAFVTLHVGAGTFQPVRVENILEHRMHFEYVEVSQKTCDHIKVTHEKGGRVIAVGTTSARSLETAAASGELKPFAGDTNLFIYPGFHFHAIDGLITNFHLPKSTLLMLVSAFAEREHVLAAYQEAIACDYRFYSYGDAMFLI